MRRQRLIVEAYLNGGGWQLMGELREVETGKGKDAVERRPQLKVALAACKRQKATLVIAKVDRLPRNTHFITGLQKSKVDFVACDYPFADTMQVQVLAVFAEHERDMIAERTSERLQALKTSGQPWISKKSGRLVEHLGSPDPSKSSAAGCERSKAESRLAMLASIWASSPSPEQRLSSQPNKR